MNRPILRACVAVGLAVYVLVAIFGLVTLSTSIDASQIQGTATVTCLFTKVATSTPDIYKVRFEQNPNLPAAPGYSTC